MNGTVALVGGAEWTEGCTFDAALIDGVDEVLVIPTALAYENPGHALARAEAWFAQFGARLRVLDIYRRADAMSADVAEAADARLIYVPGGSPMHLRSVLHETPLLDALVSAWSNGANVAASAEGASTLCAHMVDSRGGAFTVGLGLITTMTVVPAPTSGRTTSSTARCSSPTVGCPSSGSTSGRHWSTSPTAPGASRARVE